MYLVLSPSMCWEHHQAAQIDFHQRRELAKSWVSLSDRPMCSRSCSSSLHAIPGLPLFLLLLWQPVHCLRVNLVTFHTACISKPSEPTNLSMPYDLLCSPSCPSSDFNIDCHVFPMNFQTLSLPFMSALFALGRI